MTSPERSDHISEDKCQERLAFTIDPEGIRGVFKQIPTAVHTSHDLDLLSSGEM